MVTSDTFIHREMCLLDIMFQCQDVFTVYNVHVCVFVCTYDASVDVCLACSLISRQSVKRGTREINTVIS